MINYSKIYTGIFNLLLVELEYTPKKIRLNRKTGHLLINNDKIDYTQYDDEHTKNPRILGRQSELTELVLKSLVDYDSDNIIYNLSQPYQTYDYGAGRFQEILDANGWTVDANNTLIVRL